MRNVVYNFDSPTGYACADCGALAGMLFEDIIRNGKRED